MPELVRLYIRQVAIGFGVAAVFVALLLWFNVANLRHLIFSSSNGLLALFLLFFFNGIVFAGVQFAIAIMSMAEKPASRDDFFGPGGGLMSGRNERIPDPVPVRSEDRQDRRGETRVAGPQRPWES